jgi:predicted DNA-binding transcriptional regulator AlpA
VTLERLLTAAEVGDWLGFTADTILDWHESGKLPGIPMGNKGGRIRFRESVIASWLDSRASVRSGQLHEVR